ncbi:hypothetical protein PR048_028503 [Dryococelus australis]|uniref:Uncharacterized protein n=1 Tax=Dryococelus australis TaxID=614101 RepID=A0ABQ9GAR3_9NEOP|nr:hypothetical protein PR048_028503 [Dryococelus australis]
MGIVRDDAADWRVFSGISGFLRPCIIALLHSHLISPSSALKTSFCQQTHGVDDVKQGCSGAAAEPTPSSREAPEKTPLTHEVSPHHILVSNRPLRGSGGVVASALSSHHGDPGSILGGFIPGFSHVGIVLDDTARRLVSPALAFQRRSILESHFMSYRGMTGTYGNPVIRRVLPRPGFTHHSMRNRLLFFVLQARIDMEMRNSPSVSVWELREDIPDRSSARSGRARQSSAGLRGVLDRVRLVGAKSVRVLLLVGRETGACGVLATADFSGNHECTCYLVVIQGIILGRLAHYRPISSVLTFACISRSGHGKFVTQPPVQDMHSLVMNSYHEEQLEQKLMFQVHENVNTKSETDIESVVMSHHTMLLDQMQLGHQTNVRKVRLTVDNLEKLAPLLFAMNHHYNAHWVTAFIRDLQTLPEMIQEEFEAGHCGVRRSNRRLSSIPINHVHEYANKRVKSVSCVIGLAVSTQLLERWIATGPEVSHVTAQFTNAYYDADSEE